MTNIYINITLVYPLSALILCCALNTFLSRNFVRLASQIDEFTAETDVLKSGELAARVRTWKRQHVILYETANQLNHSFSYFLLFTIATDFVHTINLSFLVLTFQLDSFSLFHVWLYINFNIFQLWAICYTADDVLIQVGAVFHHFTQSVP